MRLLDLFNQLTAPPGKPEPEPEVTPADVSEAAAYQLDIVLPWFEFLAGVRRKCEEAGLTEEQTNLTIDAFLRSMLEGME